MSSDETDEVLLGMAAKNLQIGADYCHQWILWVTDFSPIITFIVQLWNAMKSSRRTFSSCFMLGASPFQHAA